MSCWETLGIDETSDKKVIKRAYSKKLKVTRPEDNAEEFQKLHQAYKVALAISSNQGVNDDTSLSGYKVYLENVVLFEDEPKSVVTEPQSFNKPVSSQCNLTNEQQEFNDEYESLLELTQMNLAQTTPRKAASYWEVLLDSSYLLDPEFNSVLGDKIFELVSEHNFCKRKKSQRVSHKVLNFLNSIFHWKQNEDYLSMTFGEEQARSVFFYLTEQSELSNEGKALKSLVGAHSVVEIYSNSRGMVDTEDYIVNPIKRLFAFGIDLAILYPILYICFPLFAQLYPEGTPLSGKYYFLVCIPVFSLYFCLMELSRLQATIGKWLLGIKVVNQNFHRLHWLHSLWRGISFGITAFFTFVTVIVNIFLATKLCHDRMSNSFAVDYREATK